jgi:murein L,D-transpeptidase YcbB/YkuD
MWMSHWIGALAGVGLWLASGTPQDDATAGSLAPPEAPSARQLAAAPAPTSARALIGVLAGQDHAARNYAEDAELGVEPLGNGRWLRRTAATGLGPTGESTTAEPAGAFNVRGRLEANLERLDELPARLPATYVVVNIPQARLWMVKNGQVEGSMRVVVGRPDQPTPQMSARLTHIVLNPRWHVPQDIVRSQLAAPAAKTRGESLIAGGYEVMSSWQDDAVPVPPSEINWRAVMAGDQEVAVRQRPGAGNMMGQAKFIMPNSQGIYLHDTPDDALFALDRRTASAGCVRLSDHERLIAFLLQGPPPAAVSPERPTYVRLQEAVPIFITYVTALPTTRGVRLLDDPYGLDALASR